MRRLIRRSGLTWVGLGLILLWLLVAGLLPFVAGVLVARGQALEDEQTAAPMVDRLERSERYTPAARGARPALETLVAEHFPPEAVPAALRVLACESRGDPDATGAAGEIGLFQLHPLWRGLAERLYWPGVSLYSAEVNVAVAAAIWRSRGWDPWACKP